MNVTVASAESLQQLEVEFFCELVHYEAII